jgi:hypothetical protein
MRAAAAALLFTLLPAATARADVSLRSFDLSPDCVESGGEVSHRVQIAQDHWYHLHLLWARITIAHRPTGVVLRRLDRAPRIVPVGTYASRGSQGLPLFVPPGDYDVRLSLGSRRGASDLARATERLRVRPLAFLC